MAQDHSDTLRATLVAELGRAAGKPLSVEEIMARARIHPSERTKVKRALRDLAREGVLRRDAKRFTLPGATSLPPAGRALPAAWRPPLGRGRARQVLGTLKKHRDGFGFVARLDRQGDDVFLPPEEAARALDGDLVRIRMVPSRGGRTAGQVVEVVERRRRMLVGTYHARGAQSFVVPADSELIGHVPIPPTDRAGDGDVVKVALDPRASGISPRC